MKDFDELRRKREERDRPSFKMGGEEFRCRYGIPPEALADYLEMGAETPEPEAIAILDRTVLAFLVPDDREKWTAIRATGGDSDNPVTVEDIAELIRWLIAEAANRPTRQPSDSSSEGGANGTGSTAISSPPEAEASKV